MKKTEDHKGMEPDNTGTEEQRLPVVKGDRILRVEMTAEKIALSPQQIWKMVNPESSAYCPHFPSPVRMSRNTVGWRESQLDAWIASLSYDKQEVQSERR